MKNPILGSLAHKVAAAFALCAAALVLCFAVATPASAEPYTYTVTLLAGNRGTLSASVVSASGGTVTASADKVVVSGLKIGDTVSFFPGESKVSDERYYARGVRMGGIDNDDAQNAIMPSFTVDGDRDYVMAYGIAGDLVRYTVEFVDASGNELAPSRSYYGNVGDSPVVAHLYIEGYQPEAYNVTKTLVPNEADNVLRLVYNPIPAGTTPVAPAAPTAPTTTTTPAAPTVPATPTTPATPAAGGAAATGGGANPATPGGGTATGGETTIDENETPLAEPQELLNIDDDETPLAQSGGGSNPSEMAAWAMGGVALASLGAVIGAIAYLLYKKRKRENEENTQLSA